LPGRQLDLFACPPFCVPDKAQESRHDRADVFPAGRHLSYRSRKPNGRVLYQQTGWMCLECLLHGRFIQILGKQNDSHTRKSLLDARRCLESGHSWQGHVHYDNVWPARLEQSQCAWTILCLSHHYDAGMIPQADVQSSAYTCIAVHNNYLNSFSRYKLHGKVLPLPPSSTFRLIFFSKPIGVPPVVVTGERAYLTCAPRNGA
jgi:hypothetical protein